MGQASNLGLLFAHTRLTYMNTVMVHLFPLDSRKKYAQACALVTLTGSLREIRIGRTNMLDALGILQKSPFYQLSTTIALYELFIRTNYSSRMLGAGDAANYAKVYNFLYRCVHRMNGQPQIVKVTLANKRGQRVRRLLQQMENDWRSNGSRT